MSITRALAFPFLLAALLLPSLTLRADNSCDWHEANDDPPAFEHYDAEHDNDGDGIGCEQITGISSADMESLLGPATEEVVYAEPVPIGETVDLSEELPTAATDQEDDAPAIPSVRLRVNSNFRGGPGLAFPIVGGGARDSVYAWTDARYGINNYIWYHLILPDGRGWIRADLIDQLTPSPDQ
jgi:hypothetical protein